MKRKLIAIALLSLASTGAFAATTSSTSAAGGTAGALSSGHAAAFATSSQAAIASPYLIGTNVTATQTVSTLGTGYAEAGSGGSAYSSLTLPSWHH
ncbi:MAG TPA: hypothetical protein VJ642_11910 [Chromobacteriaceae bacterium]|nr:hypothetical protein [Chromobacteriaceae bacterium]